MKNVVFSRRTACAVLLLAFAQAILLAANPKAAKKGTVVVFATGGTIAGTGDAGKSTGYTPGQITAEQLVASVPSLGEVAPIEAVQVCNINSDDVSAKIWLELAAAINERAKDPNVAGFVVTHGTDTMEETAFFLNLAVKTDKPVVLTGSMRPATAISADGAMNLHQAATVAANPDAKGRGVMVVFSDQIYSARFMTKTHTSAVSTMSGGLEGAMGAVLDGIVYWNYRVEKPHTTASEFDVSKFSALKKVSVVYFQAEADAELLKFAAEHSNGVVVAGAGMGEYSKEFIAAIDEAKVPVVISSRVGNGIVTLNSLLNKNAITAYDLPPQKAAILLRLALTAGKTKAELQQIFAKY